MLMMGLALALFAQAAPAPPGNEQIRGSVTLPNLEGVPADDKGQHLKIASFTWGNGATADAPPAEGSVVVKVEYPWTACKVGANYPSLALSGGGKRYVVEDVTVSKCGKKAESATFDYKKVTVSAWEPTKKE
ncbi:hypothetical protein LZ496_12445 [Sphingomonas sp. NSE70-1]|uniref:Uncharacterized protein n=1 Tax=Sphingomonas caseinilyticus TaxID=2908205 RepID=A0ABT0RX39_9SPHN|nr:hypothetical protein [Sphingomonas caseinilyticus]MCL6699589.1 hypothetical protein [Sphingomonas caseinilyticus]